MEVALLTSKADRLTRLPSPEIEALNGDDFGDPDLTQTHDLARKVFRENHLTRFSRVHFGNEFCQKLIPAPEEMTRAIDAAERFGLGFSLVTPYLTDAGLESVARLLPVLERRVPQAEVTVNDFGLLRMLRRSSCGLRIALGRLMNKMMRDPRTGPYYRTPQAPAHALAALRGTPLGSEPYRAFLRANGVQRLELDQPYQGVDLPETPGFGLSIHVPFGFVATGRLCLPGSHGRPAGEKFAVGAACDAECGDFVFRFGNEASPFEDRDLAIFNRGNTVFYRHDAEMLRESVKTLPRRGVDRIIYAPEIPM